jgi:hypothetical protein
MNIVTPHRGSFFRFRLMLPLLLASCQAPSRPSLPAVRADVCVYGATAGGVAAAVAAAREGRSVVLLDPARHVGGMTTGGLGATDAGHRATIGGIAREFYARVRRHYEMTYGPGSEQVRDCAGGFLFEPHVAAGVMRDLLREAGIEPRLGRRLAALDMAGGRIASARTADGESFAAAVWIDATYEGDLMALAGVPYAVGREGRADYGESLAGVQERSPAHQWPFAVNPVDDDGRLLPCVQPGPAGAPGAGDRKIQAYNYRLCMTDRKDNRVPFPRPAGYDPARYALLARYLAKLENPRIDRLMHPKRMPNGKTDTNNNGPFSTDHIGANRDYPDGDEATRERIRRDHMEYIQGFLYFLCHDPQVPESLRREMQGWGLAADEFVETGHWPPQLYVREARRMRGAVVMTEADLFRDVVKPDAVGMGSYQTDSHHVQRVVGPDGAVLNEGDFQKAVPPYAIPYRCLTPRAGDCGNLLVPVCVSATHVAYGSLRMEPVFMILGHASGVAAALAIEKGTSVQDVPLDRLRERLTAQGAVLGVPR